MKPLISIIVPVYNTEKFIAETIQSVIDQSYTHWELILVDDGSTDQSPQIIKTLASTDSRIKYYYKKNGGQASARNFGIKKSEGEYISFLDADDLLLEHKLSTQIDEFEKIKPDFLYGLGYLYYPERKKKTVAYDWISGEMSGEIFFKELYHNCAVNINTVLVKKEFFETVGYFNEKEEFRGTEDLEFWFRVAKKFNTIYGSPSRNVYYRIHDGGIHLRRSAMLISRLKIMEVYEKDEWVSRLLRKREYRYLYRELMNYQFEEKKHNEIKKTFQSFFSKDSIGLGTLSQALFIRILPLNIFMKFSNKLVYRIAYRLEKLSYKLFSK